MRTYSKLCIFWSFITLLQDFSIIYKIHFTPTGGQKNTVIFYLSVLACLSKFLLFLSLRRHHHIHAGIVIHVVFSAPAHWVLSVLFVNGLFKVKNSRQRCSLWCHVFRYLQFNFGYRYFYQSFNSSIRKNCISTLR